MNAHVNDIFDPDELAAMVAEGYIRACAGPDGMTLYNYTPRAQYGRVWNQATLACRGLIVRADGTIQSRPFGKFFNLSEHQNPELPALPVEPFEVFEKLDGSLIVASAWGGGTLLTTRGSFQSEQAIAARVMWDAYYCDVVIPEGETWLFEFIAPWNRIVVDYGDHTNLFLLARIDNATGRDLPTREVWWPGPAARRFAGLDDFEAIAAMLATLGPNDEGFVLRFASGMRAKAKGVEYMRLHKLITGVSARTIWENLASGTPLDEVLDRVPDEFAQWVRDTADALLDSYMEIDRVCREKHAAIIDLPSRKDQALAILDFEHKAVVFKMLDGHVFSDHIWKSLRPAADRPFRTEDES